MSVDLLKALAPELDPGDASQDARMDLFLGMAAARMNAPAFGALYGQAAAYLAAHLMTLSGRALEDGSAAPGALRSISTGDQSRSFGPTASVVATLGDAALASTVYGEQFLSIRNSRAAAGPYLVRVG